MIIYNFLKDNKSNNFYFPFFSAPFYLLLHQFLVYSADYCFSKPICFGERVVLKIFRGIYLDFTLAFPFIIQLLIIMRRHYTFLLITLLIVYTFASDCPVDQSKQPKIYSDSVGLTADNNNNSNTAQNLIYNYQFEKPLPGAPSVAIGLNQIQASPSPVLDLKVTNPRATPTGLYFQAQSGKESKWQNFKINFMATTRNDMELGSIQTRSPVINPNDNTFNMIYPMKKDLPSSGLKLNYFIQGINVQSKNKGQVGVRKESYSLANRQIFFTFSSPVRSSILRSLSISFVVYNIYTPGVLYADGIIDQNYVISKTEITIPRHGINELRTYLVGINSFQTSSADPVSIYSAISEKFQLQIGPIDRNQINFVSVSYLILSIVDCGSCEGNPLLFDGICQPICPPGYKPYKGRCVPERCQQGQTLNPQGKCVSVCTGPNQIYYSGTCVCAQDFYRIDGVCQKCQQGNYYDFTTGRCRPLCGLNSVYRNGRCYCNPGFFIINNRCQQCAYGTKYDYQAQSCVDICGDNQVYSPIGCVCANGYNLINGVCSRCPYNRFFDPDTKQCVCNQGFDLVFDQCVPACKKNQVRVEGACVCAPGFYPMHDGCYKCGPNSYYSLAHLACICAEGFKPTAQGCVPDCKADQYYQNGQCINYCKIYETYVNNRCQCDLDSQRVNGVCVPKCVMNQYRNEQGKCVCLPGYYKGPYPICQQVNCPVGTAFDEIRADCISICKANQVYVNGGCVCKFGYNSFNAFGECVPACTAYEENINGFCQCISGYIRVALGVCVPQQTGPGACPPGAIFIYGQCLPPTPCGINEYWCGSGCACISGFYRVNGQCVPVQPTFLCPVYSESNGVNCVCQRGFYPIVPGSCDRCPPGTYWDGKSCSYSGGGDHQCKKGWLWHPIHACCYYPGDCGDNQEWDGASCRCKQGFFLIKGSCQKCPKGTVFDGYRCTPGFNHCKDPYSFWNGYSCACMAGYWPLAKGKCVSCPKDTVWDGTCCQPKYGRYLQTVSALPL